MFRYAVIFMVFIGLAAQSAFAETPAEILAAIQKDAGTQTSSAAQGEKFFKSKHGGELSCSSCHTENPADQGKHAKTNKLIDPLAPAANAERFTSMKKVEKWFKRNCNDVLSRECTAQEKGDVLSYLLTVKK
jgi:mono/diheme cytochrome c family protein